MIELFTQAVLKINEILFNNLGLTIIVLGLLSRLLVHPLFASSIRYTKTASELKPKLDEIRRKHSKDARKLYSEHSRLFREAGINPATGAVAGCLSIIVQIGIVLLLFPTINRLVSSGVPTAFLSWDLAQPDTFRISGIPFGLPGILVVLTAATTFIQSKMISPRAQKGGASVKDKKKEPDLAESFAASQGALVYFIPLMVLFWGTRFASGIILYWLATTFFGIIQQYLVIGAGGLGPWLAKIKLQR